MSFLVRQGKRAFAALAGGIAFTALYYGLLYTEIRRFGVIGLDPPHWTSYGTGLILAVLNGPTALLKCWR